MPLQRTSFAFDIAVSEPWSSAFSAGGVSCGERRESRMASGEKAEAEEQPLRQLRRYVEPHPEWPDDFILIARTEDGEDLTIVRVADVKPSEESMDGADA